MKCTKLSVIVLAIVISFVSCGYSAYKDYYCDISDYTKIWNLSGFRHGYQGVSTFFPQEVEKLTVDDYFFRYDQQLPLGEGIQLLLKICYEKESFLAELERITSLATECTNQFDNQELVYSVRFGDKSFEYACIDEKDQSICYIYLQNIPKSEVEFEHIYLPRNYTEYGNIQ